MHLNISSEIAHRHATCMSMTHIVIHVVATKQTLNLLINNCRTGENCSFGSPNIVLRTFAITNVVFVKIGLETLTSCKPYPHTYFPLF
jgi:hypothetical protein